jgi:hypothetical protein
VIDNSLSGSKILKSSEIVVSSRIIGNVCSDSIGSAVSKNSCGVLNRIFSYAKRLNSYTEVCLSALIKVGKVDIVLCEAEYSTGILKVINKLLCFSLGKVILGLVDNDTSRIIGNCLCCKVNGLNLKSALSKDSYKLSCVGIDVC